jgi:hypothetical protein
MSAAQNRNYEVIYGVGLLDDIHNYFPALLYDHNRFQNLTHVFHYIRHQMNTRFNLFAYGASVYQGQDDFQAIPTVILTPQMGAAAGGGPRTTQRTFGAAAQTVPFGATAQESDVFANLNTANFLLNLLNASTGLADPTPPARGGVIRQGGARGGGGGLGAWLNQPVVVRPSQAVISSATELITGTDISGNNVCAICQDTILGTASVRRLRACRHVYHRGCIDQWFEQSVLCPTCRHDIREGGQRPTE